MARHAAPVVLSATGIDVVTPHPPPVFLVDTVTTTTTLFFLFFVCVCGLAVVSCLRLFVRTAIALLLPGFVTPLTAMRPFTLP